MRIMDWIMRIVAWTALISLVFTSCSTINVMQDRLAKIHYIDSAIKPYTQRFIGAANRRDVKVDLSRLTVVFGSTKTKDEPRTIGTCEDMHGWPVVFISEEYWDGSDEWEKEALIFHELGHCILDRDHCDIKRNGKAISIMESEMGSSFEYQLGREELVNELFAPDQECTGRRKKKSTTHNQYES